MRKLICMLALAALPALGSAQESDFGVWYSAGVEKKIDKKWSVEAEGEFRTRNDSKTADRWSFGLDAAYKLARGLKLSAGYALLYNNNREKINYDDDGDYENWRPSYWGIRHRTNVSLTGSVDLGRFSFSLRERWQYTYRPAKTTERYDFTDSAWEDFTVKGKGKNVLRSRLQAEYNIPNCKVDPFANVELFNSWSLQKVRYTVGVDWKIRKQHVFSAFYRYQDISKEDDDNDPDMHILGLSYKYKF